MVGEEIGVIRNFESLYDVVSKEIDRIPVMAKFLLWLLLLIFCWPLALAALVLYPLVWLFLLPFRIVGIAVDGILQTLKALILLPARILRGPRPV
jgi:hypothetical protein